MQSPSLKVVIIAIILSVFTGSLIGGSIRNRRKIDRARIQRLRTAGPPQQACTLGVTFVSKEIWGEGNGTMFKWDMTCSSGNTDVCEFFLWEKLDVMEVNGTWTHVTSYCSDYSLPCAQMAPQRFIASHGWGFDGWLQSGRTYRVTCDVWVGQCNYLGVFKTSQSITWVAPL